jgi:hypothetical protein
MRKENVQHLIRDTYAWGHWSQDRPFATRLYESRVLDCGNALYLIASALAPPTYTCSHEIPITWHWLWGFGV